MPERIPSLEHMREYHRTHPFTVWEGEKGGSACGKSYRTRLRAIIAALWASLYSGHDVWIERAMPRIEFAPQTGPHGPVGDSGAARPPRGPSGVSRPQRASDGPPTPPAPPQHPSRGSGL